MISKKSNVTMFFVFVVVTIIVVMLTAFMAPMGARFSTEMYVAGEGILADTQPAIDKIQDATVKAQIQDSFDQAQAATQDNIEVTTDLFKYSWIIVTILVCLIIFLFTRMRVEVGSSGLI